VVTSRAASDNLTDDQDTQTNGLVAPPKQSRSQSLGNSAPAKNDDAVSDGTAGGGVSPNGTPAGRKDEAPAKDDTVVDGVPALPADTIASPRAVQPKASDGGRAAAAGKDQPSADDSPVLSFGPPPSAPAQPAVEDPAIAYPADKPASDDPVVSGAPSPSVSPAAFAWEMPDPPSHSPSSPARTFLRSGTAAKNSPAPKTGSSSGGDGKATAGKGQAAPRAAAQKASGTQLKRTARQAHLTVARVEPWSVMKFSFVVSLVAFVILFVAVSVLYGALAGLGVFDSLQRVVSDVTSSQGSTGVNAKAWFSASRVLGYTALLGSLNIVLITAMSTIGAVVYNLTSRLVGGVEVTLKETE
jgi:Transmembrane domain of unknown function (DUF3566)